MPDSDPESRIELTELLMTFQYESSRGLGKRTLPMHVVCGLVDFLHPKLKVRKRRRPNAASHPWNRKWSK